jgi:hypothetical protein
MLNSQKDHSNDDSRLKRLHDQEKLLYGTMKQYHIHHTELSPVRRSPFLISIIRVVVHSILCLKLVFSYNYYKRKNQLAYHLPGVEEARYTPTWKTQPENMTAFRIDRREWAEAQPSTARRNFLPGQH